MSQYVSGLNPRLLSWARKCAGLSIQDVAEALSKEPAVIHAWEEGVLSPTYVQLETLAYKVYKRPIAIFFFPEPPDEPGIEHSFRTLPDFEFQKLSADTRYRIRKAQALQLSLRELSEGRNTAPRLIFRDITVRSLDQSPRSAILVRDYLGISVDAQARWRNTREAFKAWREALERVGLYVFKDSFKQEDISGFCLADDEFPLIYINNSTAFSRQIFTAFHELAHILSRVSGITKKDDQFIDSLAEPEREVEVFCNRFAAEFLVPSNNFRNLLRGRSYEDQLVVDLAQYFKVSREVILRKFLDDGGVDSNFYRNKVQQWADERDTVNQEGSGGNYYSTQASYLGDKYLRLAFTRYYEHKCSIEQLADHLHVKASSVPGLEPVEFR